MQIADGFDIRQYTSGYHQRQHMHGYEQGCAHGEGDQHFRWNMRFGIQLHLYHSDLWTMTDLCRVLEIISAHLLSEQYRET